MRIMLATTSTITDSAQLMKIAALIPEGAALSDCNEQSTLKSSTQTNGSEISSTFKNHGCNEFDYDSVNDLFHDLIKWTTKLLSIQTFLQTSVLFKSSVAQNDGEIQSELAKDDMARKALTEMLCVQQMLNSLADLVLTSVPSASGDHINDKPKAYFSIYNDASVGAYHMFWPLGALVASPWVTENRKIMARSALRTIGGRFCIIQAFRYI